jgi:hypothetical protein
MGELQYPEMRVSPSISASGTYAALPGAIVVTLGNFVEVGVKARFDASGSGFTAASAYNIRSTSNNSYIEGSAEL